MAVPAENLMDLYDHEAHRNLVDLVEQEISENGYTLGQPIGEGHTRVAYLATYQSGKFRQSRVVKIPKVGVEDTTSSICTRINLSKGDLDGREAAQAGEIEHPNVIDLLDSFEVDGHTINVEEYFNAENLEDFIRSWGPIQDEDKFRDIFRQAISGSEYLSHDLDMLHRDIKPSNILIRSKDGLVKLDDLQNARDRRSIEERLFPTRGGTAYTHPSLLNSLVDREAAGASERTETYSMAASMYFALTGEAPFDYRIREVEEGGAEVEIGGEPTRIQLYIDGEEADQITPGTHEKSLRKALKKIPKKYRKMLHRGLTVGPEAYRGYHPLSELKRDLEKTKEGPISKFAKSAARFIKPLMIAGVIGGLAGLGLYHGKIEAAKEPIPTLAEVMANTQYREFCLEGLTPGEQRYMLADLHEVNRDLEEDILEDNINKPGKQPDIVHWRAVNQAWHNGSDLRLSSALLRSSVLYQEDLDRTFEGQKRHGTMQVPEGFAYSWAAGWIGSTGRNPIDTWQEGELASVAYQYLKLCLGPEKTAADVSADYYCTDEEVVNAKTMSGNSHYFSRILDEDGDGIGTVIEGYRGFIPHGKRQAIDRAVAFYNITDKEGNIDLSQIPGYGEGYSPQLSGRHVIPQSH